MLEIGDPCDCREAEAGSQPGRVLEDQIHALRAERVLGGAIPLEEEAPRQTRRAPAAAVPERMEPRRRREMGRQILELGRVHIGPREEERLHPAAATDHIEKAPLRTVTPKPVAGTSRWDAIKAPRWLRRSG